MTVEKESIEIGKWVYSSEPEKYTSGQIIDFKNKSIILEDIYGVISEIPISDLELYFYWE